MLELVAVVAAPPQEVVDAVADGAAVLAVVVVKVEEVEAKEVNGFAAVDAEEGTTAEEEEVKPPNGDGFAGSSCFLSPKVVDAEGPNDVAPKGFLTSFDDDVVVVAVVVDAATAEPQEFAEGATTVEEEVVPKVAKGLLLLLFSFGAVF